MSFTSLNRIIHTIFGPQKIWQVTLLKNWSHIAGTLGTKVTIEKLYNDTIVLGVQDSCWLQELHLLSPTLLHRINQTLDQPRLKKIRFKKLGITSKRSKKRTKLIRQVQKQYRVTAHEEKVLASVVNQELRSALKAFLIRCHRERGCEKGTITQHSSTDH